MSTPPGPLKFRPAANLYRVTASATFKWGVFYAVDNPDQIGRFTASIFFRTKRAARTHGSHLGQGPWFLAERVENK